MALKIKQYLQQETVLIIAWILAIASSFFVIPGLEYLNYIDWDTLALLLALMIVMAGFKSLGLFSMMGHMLLSKVKSERAVEAVMVMACFFSSMFITNDVALITFVPFAIETLKMAGMKDKILSVVVFQTIAANLGSMVTPIGNPQNIYLYFQSGFSAAQFLAITLPYAVVSLLLLGAFIVLKKNKKLSLEMTEEAQKPADKKMLIFYGLMFALCLASLSRVISVCLVALIVVALVLVRDREILGQVDYSLLFTFIGFFIFVGNIQHMPILSDAIASMLKGNELLATIGISQVISNVPAVLLLTGFTHSWKMLIVGSNLGGLGTLIASMASLISYKYVAKECPTDKMKYMGMFTAANAFFLGANLLVVLFLG